jgi:hypothetical protein
MRISQRLALLGSLLLAAGLLLGFVPASPAFAATTASPTNPATAKLALSSVSLENISESLALSGNASTPCKTVTFQRNYTGAGITIAWLKMVTTWCYNNVIVTSHSTILYWGVTAYGSALGWYIQHSTPNYSFNCYVASGSTRNCSGNHEATKQFWRNGSAGVGLALTVVESETYKGQASASGATQNCVGSCA